MRSISIELCNARSNCSGTKEDLHSSCKKVMPSCQKVGCHTFQTKNMPDLQAEAADRDCQNRAKKEVLQRETRASMPSSIRERMQKSSRWEVPDQQRDQVPGYSRRDLRARPHKGMPKRASSGITCTRLEIIKLLLRRFRSAKWWAKTASLIKNAPPNMRWSAKQLQDTTLLVTDTFKSTATISRWRSAKM